MTIKLHPKEHLFHRAYANIPLGERKMPCCVVDDEPMSWFVTKIEIENKTEIGYKAIDSLIKMGII